jgi:phosphate ABC transporter phosphate-binding protein
MSTDSRGCNKALLVASFCILIASARAAQPRLYVEPFTTPSSTKAAPEQLRDHVISEIRKSNAFSLVPSESSADLILGGGGEIWVKGYRSLNPRSGTSPVNGTPVYGGYLSVELRDSRGETLWSDLVTPDPASTNIARDISRIIARHISAALPRISANPSTQPAAQPALLLKAAGATFPAPVYQKWIQNYRRQAPNLEISYQPVGSEAGIRQLLASAVDFGASDSSQAIRDIAPGREGEFLFFPSVAGAVVPIVNLPGFNGIVNFTPETLAGIYLGKIKKWNDPLLRQANRGVHLPDLDITVVHRSDGSGTTYAFTEFLSQTSPEWKSGVGAALSPNWPAGRGAPGNEGVAKLVKELSGSIGYVEFIYAIQNHLASGKVRNRSGEFMAATLESIAIATTQAARQTSGLKIDIVNSPGEGAYPIATFTWFVVPAHIANEQKRSALAGFLKWMLGPGQKQAAALGYLALPNDLVARESAALAQLH